MVSSSGMLFTWGDGFCGKLGHGTVDSHSSPRVVEALKGRNVLQVSCGTWHTACIAEERGEEVRWNRYGERLWEAGVQVWFGSPSAGW